MPGPFSPPTLALVFIARIQSADDTCYGRTTRRIGDVLPPIMYARLGLLFLGKLMVNLLQVVKRTNTPLAKG